MESTGEVAAKTSEVEVDTVRQHGGSELSPEWDDDHSTYAEIVRLLLESLGLDSSAYRFLMTERNAIDQLARERGRSVEQYAELVRNDPGEQDNLYRRLFRSRETFFGDAEAHQVLSRSVIPHLIKRREPEDVVRVWVVGGGTGEEAYTIAILLHEALVPENIPNKVRIFATDVHDRALSIGRAALYSADSVATLSETRRNRYFCETPGGYEVIPEIRGMVTFAKHDVLRDPPLVKLDFIVCRALLGLFKPATQKRVLSLFYLALKSEGILLLGPRESITQREDLFEPLHVTGNTFRKWRSPPLRFVSDSTSLAPGIPLNESTGFSPRMVSDRQLLAILDSLLCRFISSGFLIGENRELIYCFGKGAELLSIQRGRSSADILTLVPLELRALLAGALSPVKETGEGHRFEQVLVTLADGKKKELTIIIQPLMIPGALTQGILVSFEESSEPLGSESAKGDNQRAQTMPGLTQELAYTGETLLETLEELEAVYDRLQVTSHELQVTQEELSSVTEELNAINTDCQAKVAELSHLRIDLEAILDDDDVAVLLLDDAHHLRRFSPAIARLLALTAQDIGHPFDTLGTRFSDSDLVPDLERVRGEGITVERVFGDAEGRLFNLKLRPHRMHGMLAAVVLSIVEVTNLMKNKRDASDCAARYGALMASIEGAVWRMDEFGAIQESESSWEAFSGQSWSEQRGFGWVMAIAEGDRALVVELLSPENIGARGDAGPISVRVWSARHKEHRVCSLRLSQVGGNGSESLGWLVTLVDEHDLDRTHELLIESEIIRHLVEQAPVGIAVQDCVGRYRWSNKRYAEVHHLPPGQIEGKTDHDLFPLEIAEVSRSHVMEVARTGELRENEETMPSFGEEDSAPGILLVSRYPLTLVNGGGVGIATVTIDITERKRVEQKALEAVRLRDSFMATIAHEIRNPLHAILSAIAVFQTGETSPEVLARALGVIARQSQQVSRLVDDLMTMTRSQQDKLRLHCRKIDLRPIIESAIEQVRLDLDSKHQQLLVEMPDEPVRVWGDDDRLRQLVANLVDNASKYSSAQTRIQICVTCEGAQATLSVQDEGQGIAPEQLGRVFQKYTQFEGGGATHSQGVGLGLWVAQEIATQHGGALRALSKGLGQGSEFIVTLPLVRQDSVAGEDLSELPRNAPGERILLVEDNADASEMLRLVLASKGFDVDIASSGEEALEHVQEHCPVAALVDIGLPDMSGLDVARRLRAEHPRSPLFMIAVSGYGEEQDRQAARDAGFDAYLTKPVRVEDVVALLH